MTYDSFDPAATTWFSRTSPAPTAAQSAASSTIRARRDTLVAAPTGSGKTLTAFLAALDDLVVRGQAPRGLPDETAVVYVSPLKALSNDIRLNLDAPLAGIRAELAALGCPMSTFARRCARATCRNGSGSRACAGRRPSG